MFFFSFNVSISTVLVAYNCVSQSQSTVLSHRDVSAGLIIGPMEFPVSHIYVGATKSDTHMHSGSAMLPYLMDLFVNDIGENTVSNFIVFIALAINFKV